MGFQRIAAFGPYVGIPTSVCFEKTLHDSSLSPESVVQRQLDAYNVRDNEFRSYSFAIRTQAS